MWEIREAEIRATHDWVPVGRPAGTIGCVTDGGWTMLPVTHECSRCGTPCNEGHLTLRIAAADEVWTERKSAWSQETCGTAVVRKVMES